MRKLCKAELMVLKQYGFLEKEEIEKEEYNDIINKIPYYVFCCNDTYYKYIVPEDVTDELIEQLERAVSLELQSENNEKIKLIQKDVDFFKMLTVIMLILIIAGVCVAFIKPML